MQQILEQQMVEESKEQRLVRRHAQLIKSCLTRQILPVASSGSFAAQVLAKETSRKSNPGAAISK